MKKTQNNYLAPDGFRYGVRWASDGSVANVWNGKTQRQRAEEYIVHVIEEQMARAGRHDVLILVRKRPGEAWETVDSDSVDSTQPIP